MTNTNRDGRDYLRERSSMMSGIVGGKDVDKGPADLCHSCRKTSTCKYYSSLQNLLIANHNLLDIELAQIVFGMLVIKGDMDEGGAFSVMDKRRLLMECGNKPAVGMVYCPHYDARPGESGG